LPRDARRKARSACIPLRGTVNPAVDWQQILGLVEGSLVYHDVSAVYVALQSIAERFGPNIRGISDTIAQPQAALSSGRSRAIALQIDVHGVLCQLHLTVPRVLEVDKELFHNDAWLPTDLSDAIANASLVEAQEWLAAAEERLKPTRISEILKAPLGPDGMPAVCSAVAMEQADMLELLLNAGAPANSRTEAGKAAVELAYDQESWPCLSMLLLRGADPAPIEHKFSDVPSGSFAAQAARLAAQMQEQRRIDAQILARLVERCDGSDLSLSSAASLLQASADSNAMTELTHDGETLSLLSCASQHGSQPLVRLLIKHGARVRNTKGAASAIRLAKNTTAEGIITRQSDEEFQWAVSHHDLDAIFALLDAGMNPEAYAAGGASFDEGRTLVMYAIELGQKDADSAVALLRKAVNNGANLERKNSLGMTALHIALDRAASVVVVQTLLSLQADAEAADMQGRTAAMFAAGKTSLENLRLVLDFNAKADRRDACGRDSTMHAFIAVQADNTNFLLDHGHVLDRAGALAELFLAVRLGAASHVRKLLAIAVRPYPRIARATEDGANAQNYVASNTLLMEAVVLGSASTVEALLEYGARMHPQKAVKGGGWESAWTLSSTSPSARAALRSAVQNELLSIARERDTLALRALSAEEANGLVVGEEDLEAVDADGCTALDYAVIKGCVEIEVWLCQRGAKLRYTRNSTLALREPVRWNHSETISRRLAAGANVNAADGRGYTPLDWAVLCGIFSGYLWTSFEQGVVDGDGNNRPEVHSESSSEASGAQMEPLSRGVSGKDILADPLGTYATIEEMLCAAGGRLGPAVRAARYSVLHPLQQGDIQAVQRRILAGADCAIYTERGLGLVHVALRLDHPDIAKLMVEHKADLDCRDEAGKTVLWRAVEQKCAQLAEACIDNGADVLLGIGDGNDGSVAQLALSTSQPGLAVRVLKASGGAALVDRLEAGRTLLQRAEELNATAVVSACLECKADALLVDSRPLATSDAGVGQDATAAASAELPERAEGVSRNSGSRSGWEAEEEGAASSSYSSESVSSSSSSDEVGAGHPAEEESADDANDSSGPDEAEEE